REFWRKIMGSDEPHSESEGNLAHSEFPMYDISIEASNHSPTIRILNPTRIQATIPSVTTASIVTLPVEVLMSIFEAVLGEYDYSVIGIAKPTRLSQVCCAWRSVVIGRMPKAWSTINIQFQKGIVQLVELWLIRTGDSCPLELTLRTERDTLAILRLLLPYSDRWHRIWFRLTPECEPAFSLATPSNLVAVFELSTHDRAVKDRFWGVVNRSKQLRQVFWEGIIPQSTPWAQIEDVDVGCDSIQILQNVLPQLTRLTTLYARIYQSDPPQNNPPIKLPLLCTLHIIGPYAITLLDCILAPSLKDLHVDLSHRHRRRAGEVHLPSVTRFLERSACSLEVLSLDVYDDMDELHLPEFLLRSRHNTKALKELCLMCKNPPDDAILLLGTPAPPHMQLLPSLESFYLRGGFPRTDGLLGSMIRSRFLHGSLRSVYLNIYRKDAHGQDVLMLESLKEGGQDVDWSIAIT
ncbi:hypothetical protein AX16_010512, partial [Volvariella volvacea WC 439]